MKKIIITVKENFSVFLVDFLILSFLTAIPRIYKVVVAFKGLSAFDNFLAISALLVRIFLIPFLFFLFAAILDLRDSEENN